jgi:hypothetical protein
MVSLGDALPCFICNFLVEIVSDHLVVFVRGTPIQTPDPSDTSPTSFVTLQYLQYASDIICVSLNHIRTLH